MIALVYIAFLLLIFCVIFGIVVVSTYVLHRIGVFSGLWSLVKTTGSIAWAGTICILASGIATYIVLLCIKTWSEITAINSCQCPEL
jgi:hypothetical protein